MNMLKRCRIIKYDETVKRPPYKFIELDTVEVEKPGNDYLGEAFFDELLDACFDKGYSFKFYSLSDDEDFDYDLVVRPPLF